MNSTRWLALATAVTACAVAYGVHVFAGHDAGPTTSAASGKTGSTPSSRVHPSVKSSAASSTPLHTRPESRDRTGSAKTPKIAEPRRILGSPDTHEGRLLSESQWRENAAKVEMAANHELERLVGLLDLDSVQQDQIFPLLAQQSPNWMPGMQVGGSVRSGEGSGNFSAPPASNQGRPARNGGTAKPVAGATPLTGVGSGGVQVFPTGTPQAPEVDLTAYLTADQQQSLVEEEMDRQAWWAEILPQLLAPTISDGDAAVAGDSGTSDTSDPAPETKEFDGGEVLLEE